MNLKSIENKGPQINLIPMLDSIFILMFLFMLTLLQRSQQSEIEVSLPTATKSSENKLLNNLSVSINFEGQIFLENKQLSKKNLERELQLIRLDQNPLPTVSIKGDKRIPLGQVIEILDLVRANGFNNVRIETSLNNTSM